MRCLSAVSGCFLASVLIAAGCSKNSDPAPSVRLVKPTAAADSAEMLKKIAGELRSKSVERRASAIAKIVEYECADAIPVLLEALADKGFTEGAIILGEPNSTREAAVIALLKLGPDGEKEAIDSGMATLTAGLSDPVAGVKEHSALALGILGPKGKAAVPALLKLCAEKDEKNVRQAAYDALRKIGDVPPAAIVQLMKNKDAAVAYDASRALLWLRPLPKEVIPGLIDVLKAPPTPNESDDVELTRQSAAEALSDFGKEAAPAIPVLVGLLPPTLEDFKAFYRSRPGADPNAINFVESTAMMGLRKIGAPAVPALIEALKSDKPFIRWQAATALGGIGPVAKDALPALQAAVAKESENKEYAVMSAAALAQVQVGGDAKEPVAKVAELLSNDDPTVRYFAAGDLARFGRKAESAVKALIPLLDDQEEGIRARAVFALQIIGPAAKAAIPALVKKLADENQSVRAGALDLLKKMGPVAAEATPELVKLLADPDEGFRRDVIGTIIAVGPAAKAVVPELTRILKTAQVRERQIVLEALAVIGPEAKSAVPGVLDLLTDQESETRFEAIKTLGRLGVTTAEVVNGLANRLKREQLLGTRVEVVRSLALLGPGAKPAAGALAEFGKSRDPQVAVWCAAALYRMGIDADANKQVVLAALKNHSPGGKLGRLAAMEAADLLGAAANEALPELTDSLHDKAPIYPKNSVQFRQRAVEALGRMGASAKPAVRELTALLKEPDADLKVATVQALGQIGPGAEYASARLREIVRTEPQFAEAAQEALDRIERK